MSDVNNHGPLIYDGGDYKVFKEGVLNHRGFFELNVGVFSAGATYNPNNKQWTPSHSLSDGIEIPNGGLSFSINNKGELEADGSVNYGPFELGVVVNSNGEVVPFAAAGLSTKLFGSRVGMTLTNEVRGMHSNSTLLVKSDGSFLKTTFEKSGGGWLQVTKEYSKSGSIVDVSKVQLPANVAARMAAEINRCFVPTTNILCENETVKNIKSVSVGDLVLSFDPSADDGRGGLVPKKVLRTFTNITDEWLRLTWVENGEEKELVTTPGHEFLAAQGGFRQIEQLVAGGAGTLVLADGSEVEVQSERLIYSAETADIFEQAEGYVFAENVNLARKPECKKSGRPATSRSKSFIRISLVEGLRKWAASLKARHTIIHVTTGSNLKSTDRLMKAAGAQFVGGAYVV